MDGFETAYYLDERQLLLLLSLIDQRPVIGLPLAGEPEDWRPIALTLLQDGRLRYEKGQLVMEEGLSGLFLTMKDAGRVLAVYGLQAEVPTRLFYLSEKTAVMEFLPNGGLRLYGTDDASVLTASIERRFPRFPAPEALEASAADNRDLRKRMAWWKAAAVSLEEPPLAWGHLAGVHCIVESYEEGNRTRWIWVKDPMASLILCQNKTKIQVELDTVSRRRRLLREWGLEVEDAAG